MELTTFIHASAHDLHQLAAQSVQMIATSPPYYLLRAYAGEQGVEWPEVTFRLNEWVEPTTVSPMRCGLGMEPTPVAFIGHLILCLREWRRVLRDDGTIWVNLGDSYAAGKSGSDDSGDNGRFGGPRIEPKERKAPDGTKPKDLLGIPWLFAIAARADGWYLRSDCIWAKPNPMPESVTDRPTKAHEYVFLLSKSQRYFWDAEGVKEPATATELGATGILFGGTKYPGKGVADGTYSGNEYVSTGTRNLRTVWNIATQPTPFAHFATWPEKLVQTMIRAGSKPGDTVLDPFNGSGTTGKVAVQLGRAYVGVDIATEYLDGVTSERFGAGVQIGMGM